MVLRLLKIIKTSRNHPEFVVSIDIQKFVRYLYALVFYRKHAG